MSSVRNVKFTPPYIYYVSNLVVEAKAYNVFKRITLLDMVNNDETQRFDRGFHLTLQKSTSG